MHTILIQDFKKTKRFTEGQIQWNKGVVHCFIALTCDWFDLLALIMTLCYGYVMNHLIL